MSYTAFIDLSTEQIEIRETSTELLDDFIGGRGVGAKILYDNVGPEVDPLSPENYIILTAGPLAGTPWPTSARLHVTFKSPLTGIYGYSNSGGHFVAEMRHAGYDVIIITGRANAPVYLEIVDDQILLKSAEHLWGRTVGEVHELLLGTETGPKRGRLACIGPAGEHLVKCAAIMNDYNRAAARSGPGAVMGSKNLKAIYVRASAKPATAAELKTAAMRSMKKLSTHEDLQLLKDKGTLFLIDLGNLGGNLPTRNHQSCQVPFGAKINADAFDKYLVARKGCYACPIRCARKSKVESGPYAVEIGGPEYETTNALGPMCWIDNPEAIIYGNHLCNDYGLDTISTGVIISFAMELHQRGLLQDERYSLEWGDEDTVMGLIKDIAMREGLGDILAEGVREASTRLNAGDVDYAPHVKGLEMPRQEPRFAKGFGLGHATGNRGADHLYGMAAMDVGGKWYVGERIASEDHVKELMDPVNEKYKPDMLIYGENYCAVTDALGVCKFSTVQEYSLMPEDLAEGLSAVRGREISGDELLQMGEKIVCLERLYNASCGIGRKDDKLPARFTSERLPLYDLRDTEQEEPIAYGYFEDFEAMLDRYYDLRGWSREGIPTEETCRRLGLGDSQTTRKEG